MRREGDRWRLDGEPTEGALYVLGLKAGLDPKLEAERLPRTDVIPFESEHRFMATLHSVACDALVVPPFSMGKMLSAPPPPAAAA